MKLAVTSLAGKESGDITLDKNVFGIEVRQDILHRMVNYQRAKRQAGTHKTKNISEVSGTGKKPFAQKGTGNARSGSMRRNINRGGAIVHGPRVRSHAHDLPKKVRMLALRTALSSKVKDKKIIILDKAESKTHKTQDMVKQLAKLGVTSAVIVTGTEVNENFGRATNNIPLIDVLPVQGANVYDILRRDQLVLTIDAVESLTERLK